MCVERTEFKKALHSSVFRAVFFCLFWLSVQGRYRLIGSSGPIVVAPGDDVILPCRVDPSWDAERKTVEWSKPDQRADASDRRRGVEYVLVYRSQRPDRDVMMASYLQRTSLSSDGLKSGDVSLRIMNVTLEDSGTFRCFVPSLRIGAEVQLAVETNVTVATPSEAPAFNTTSFYRSPSTPGPQEESLYSRLGIYIIPVVYFGLFGVLILKTQEAPSPETDQLPCTEEGGQQDQVENQPDNPGSPQKWAQARRPD